MKKNLVNNRIIILGGAGFCPSTIEHFSVTQQKQGFSLCSMWFLEESLVQMFLILKGHICTIFVY